MKQFYVLGNPIGHSRSPFIHRSFAASLGHELSYEAMLVPLDGFAAVVEKMKREGFSGCNVTVPFKEQAFALSDELSDRARFAGAVNTLAYDGSRLYGDNTDGEGLVQDLLRKKVMLEGARILVLGAGGAAKGILAPLLARNPSRLHIANRTAEKAVKLADHVRDVAGCPVTGGGFGDIAGQFDLIVNATSASISGQVPPLPEESCGSRTFAYDLMYAPEDTPFVSWAKGRGLAASDGLGMLVEQAAESYLLWCGARPETSGLIEALRRSMREESGAVHS
ncbi:MAG: shikimate dehydrogenase [Succinivibrionaceae bacterium]|nr:shikimate dehydrogenase [Succinivibrionaceae bacterium]